MRTGPPQRYWVQSVDNIAGLRVSTLKPPISGHPALSDKITISQGVYRISDASISTRSMQMQEEIVHPGCSKNTTPTTNATRPECVRPATARGHVFHSDWRRAAG